MLLGGVLVWRVGIMVGPRDPTDRFSWWPLRFAREPAEGGEVLAPGDSERLVQFSDARDVAAWMVGMLDAGTSGTYNAVGPGRDVPLAEVLDACRLAADEEDGDQADLVQTTWVGEEFLREQLREVPEEDCPLWFPEDQIPFERVDSSKSLTAGLTFRPVYETASDTLSRVRFRPAGPDLSAGFSIDFERELLRRWHAGHG